MPKRRKARDVPGSGKDVRRENTAKRAERSANEVVVNGWRLFFWIAFRERWDALAAATRDAREADPEGCVHEPTVKLFRTVRDLVFKEIPSDPDHPQYRQGKTLGAAHTHWRRAKFHRRFRLFFRFHTASRTIIYAWLNDESTLRKTGSSTDPYAVFHRMLEHGAPPSDWDRLVAECERIAAEGAAPRGSIRRI